MNERIKDLFIKSEVFISNRDGARWEIDQDKFAQLIVKDCIAEMRKSFRGDLYTGYLYECEYNNCIDDQSRMLEDRFGVNK
jgi:hypothetical protein